MTETTALITLNHPFKVGKGTIGKVLPGRDVEIRDDGEIVVRGDMVSTATWRNGAMQQAESPWLATGDLARRDAEGSSLSGAQEPGDRDVVGAEYSSRGCGGGAQCAKAGVEASAVVPLLTDRRHGAVAVLLFRGSRDEAQQAISRGESAAGEFQRVQNVARMAGTGFSPYLYRKDSAAQGNGMAEFTAGSHRRCRYRI